MKGKEATIPVASAEPAKGLRLQRGRGRKTLTKDSSGVS